MRMFHSYGPDNCKKHFCVQREHIVQNCIKSLIDDPEEEGHYFTIWAPRQTGKSWLKLQVVEAILEKYKDIFETGWISMEEVPFEDGDIKYFFNGLADVINDAFNLNIRIDNWKEFSNLFKKNKEYFKRPLLLFIDEFDKLPKNIIDQMVSSFRGIHLNRKKYVLHGLALIGVRAVLGVESDSGSPFNIQRSIHIPNLTFEETLEMFDQYQKESSQKVELQVIEKLYKMTNGQPGLIGWFGELLTDTYKYNPGYDKTIDMETWKYVYERACNAEHNNTVLNIIAKAKKEYKDYVLKLFSKSDFKFTLDADWCNYLYMHGLIDNETVKLKSGEYKTLCRFASPFIQHKIFNAFMSEIIEEPSVTSLNLLDDLSDVFQGASINVPALLKRYKDYLSRLNSKGINPWKDQPRRKTDFHLTESVGHFHLYHWLQMALSGRCAVIPEFPTGNGKVDLHLKCDNKKGLIEVKSFVNAYKIKEAMKQAAQYALDTNHKNVAVAMFVPFSDEKVLKEISVKKIVDGVNVDVVAIGQG